MFFAVRKISLTIICLVLMFVQSVAWPEKNITLNGLFADKAIFVVDGEPVLLSVGEEKFGIHLIKIKNEVAIVKIDAIPHEMVLEKVTPRKLPGVSASKLHAEAKSHIIDVRLIHQTNNIATFAVEYFFNQEEAEYAGLTAKTLFKEKDTHYWAHSVTHLKPGRHTTTISISMTHDAPDNYTSDTARFDIRLARGNRVKHTGIKLLELIKQWQK